MRPARTQRLRLTNTLEASCPDKVTASFVEKTGTS